MKISVEVLRFILLAVFIPALFPNTVKAQTPRPAPRLSLRYVVSPASPGHAASRAAQDSQATQKHSDSLALRVRVELPPGWHINSETPPDSFLVPTRLDAEAQGLQFGKPSFPPPQLVFSPAMGEKLPLYSGAFEVEFPVRRPVGDAGKIIPTTRVTLHYQACNDSMCLPPKDVTAELAAGVAEK